MFVRICAVSDGVPAGSVTDRVIVVSRSSAEPE
jgi:hypothetical protein